MKKVRLIVWKCGNSNSTRLCLSPCVRLSASAASSPLEEALGRNIRDVGGGKEQRTKSPNTPGFRKLLEKTACRAAGQCGRYGLGALFVDLHTERPAHVCHASTWIPLWTRSITFVRSGTWRPVVPAKAIWLTIKCRSHCWWTRPVSCLGEHPGIRISPPFQCLSPGCAPVCVCVCITTSFVLLVLRTKWFSSQQHKRWQKCRTFSWKHD